MLNNKVTTVLVFVLFAGVVVAATAMYWNEARKEIQYLCGNFAPGMPMANVVNQLQTAELSSYSLSQSDRGTAIIFSSPINFHFYKCIIELDDNNLVSQARFY